ncbi:MAG: biotin--[acetyl-CoA-carboxylase] ligase [Thermoleophilia bacterium]
MDPQRLDSWLRRRSEWIDGGVAQRARIVARLHSGERVSGQVLADDLGVSRAAVHKHVEALRGLGIGVSSVAGSGYRLDASADPISAEALLPLLAAAGAGLGVPYRYVPTTASTNLIARDEGRAGAPHGTVVVTDYQHTGRGRLGRSWVSEPGKDLTFSLLVRPELPPERVARLTLATSVAVADAVESLLRLDGLSGRVALKWPNDVLIDGRKVCGILSEASLDMDGVHWVAVGIGLNVNGVGQEGLRATDTPLAVPAPISLRGAVGHDVARAPLLVDLLVRLEDSMGRATGAAWQGILDRFRSLDALRGGHVQVRAGGFEPRVLASGIADGVGSEGELLLVSDDGTLQTVLSGDVTLR